MIVFNNSMNNTYEEVEKMENDVLVDYDVVSDIAGHQPNRQVVLQVAAQDIYDKVNKKAMELAVKGEFISAESPQQVAQVLREAQMSGHSIRLYDENIGG